MLAVPNFLVGAGACGDRCGPGAAAGIDDGVVGDFRRGMCHVAVRTADGSAWLCHDGSGSRPLPTPRAALTLTVSAQTRCECS